MFSGRKLLIATQHAKEKVIAPILEKQLGVQCFVSENFDTDELGTFSGEVERKDDPMTTARNKCLRAMKLTNFDLAVASEGSFGPHPSIYFIPADEEFIVFIDKRHDLEIAVRELSAETNFNGAELKSERELKAFAENTGFPLHGLIIRKSKDDNSEIVKGINNYELLSNTFDHFIAHHGTAYVETDMRAMHNPTRMKVIAKATHQLIEKINSCCPQCNTPGFGITDFKQGLPCQLCHFPTRSPISHIHCCKKCHYTYEEKFPNGKYSEDPAFCDFCNP
jgi:hypothetical protein